MAALTAEAGRCGVDRGGEVDEAGGRDLRVVVLGVDCVLQVAGKSEYNSGLGTVYLCGGRILVPGGS